MNTTTTEPALWPQRWSTFHCPECAKPLAYAFDGAKHNLWCSRPDCPCPQMDEDYGLGAPSEAAAFERLKAAHAEYEKAF